MHIRNNKFLLCRFYTFYPGMGLDFDDAHEFCLSKNLSLVKWDMLDKFYDIGFLGRKHDFVLRLLSVCLYSLYIS